MQYIILQNLVTKSAAEIAKFFSRNWFCTECLLSKNRATTISYCVSRIVYTI